MKSVHGCVFLLSESLTSRLWRFYNVNCYSLFINDLIMLVLDWHARHEFNNYLSVINSGLPNSAVSMIGNMGVSCSPKTTRNIIKKVGLNSDIKLNSRERVQKQLKKVTVHRNEEGSA